MPMSDLYKTYRAGYYRACALVILGVVLVVGVPLSWFTGRIRMDQPKPWLVWLAGIVVLAYYVARARTYLRCSEEERSRSGE